jgi:hypothetical protein
MALAENKPDLIKSWWKRLRESQFSHYEAAKRFRDRNYYLGIPVTILNVIVGSAIFISMKKDLGDDGKILFGIVALLSALLTGLQTFLKFNERAERHYASGVEASKLRRKLEQINAQNKAESLTDAELSKLRDEYDKFTTNATNVPDDIWKKIEEELKE